MKLLSEFIRDQMYKRRMNERKFATMVGVSHSVIVYQQSVYLKECVW